MPVLVLAEHDAYKLADSTLHTVMAACHISMYCDGQIHVLVVGHQMQAVQEQAARISGVSRVLVANAAHLASDMAEKVAAQVVAMAAPEPYSHILLAASMHGKSIARGLGGRLRVRPLGDIRRVISSNAFECTALEGDAKDKVVGSNVPQVLTVCTSAFEAAGREGGIGSIESVQAVPAVAPWKEATAWHFSECVSRKLAHMRTTTAIWPRFAT